MYFKTLIKSECCACTACVHACPVSAIQFSQDEEGFYYPRIDKDKCVGCGLCERVCPIEKPTYGNSNNPKVYAAMINDIEQRKKSSSGGIFYAIACWIIQQGGKVYGASIDANHKVKHIGINKLEDLSLLRGSKYVQSDLNHIFIEIKKELKLGKWCYFVGTGCQVAGLKAFLRKDYKTLLTSDLVCHGVPSQWIFNQHIDYLETKFKGKVINYQFRNNETWGGCEIFSLINSKGKIKTYKFPSYDLSPYLYSFMHGMISRYSCYDCKFACLPRQGDLTLGDYWGVKNVFPDIDSTNGISLVVVNNIKGETILQHIASLCYMRMSSVIDGAKYNGNLINVSPKHPIRDIIYKKIVSDGYSFVAENYFRTPHYHSTYIKNILAEYKIIKQFIEWKNKKK